MRSERLWRWGLRLGGGIILLIGLGHVLMPTHGYAPDAISGWSVEAVDYFYYLATYIICGFLLTLGALSLLYSSRPPSWAAAWFATAMTLLWGLRLGLEVRYPVTLPIYFLDRPHPVLVGVLTVTTLGYTVAAKAAWHELCHPGTGEGRRSCA